MEVESRPPVSAIGNIGQAPKDPWRKSCGCIKTSDKLKRLIETFPQAAPPPPPSPYYQMVSYTGQSRPVAITQPCYPFNDSSENMRLIDKHGMIFDLKKESKEIQKRNEESSNVPSLRWEWVTSIASLLQLCVTATALGIYYMLYCYMQLVYFTLKSALFFHQADGPMKVTIAVLTMTSLYVGFHILMRLEKLVGFK